MTPRNAPAKLLLYAALLAILTATVLYPQLLVVSDSLRPAVHAPGFSAELKDYTAANFKSVLTSSYNLKALWNSVWISLVSVLAAAALGVPAAFLVERARFPGRTLVLIGSILPLALPPLVGVVAFFELSQPVGIAPRLLSHLTGLTQTQCSFNGIPAVLLVHAYSFGIYFFALTRAGLAGLDPAQEAAARSLGAGFSYRLRRVILPALTPYLIAASLLTFMTSMSSFSAPYILGNGMQYLSVEIISNSQSHADRAVLAVVLALCNTIFLLVLQLGFGGAWRALAGGSKGAGGSSANGVGFAGGVTQLQKPAAKILAAAAAALFCGLMALPFLVIAINAVADHNAWNGSATILPPAWTTDAFHWLSTDPGAHAAILTSILATLAAVLLNLVFAFAAALYIVRGSRLIRFATDFLCMLPIALPGTVIAFNLLAAFNTPTWITFNYSLSSTLAILVIAYFVRQIPLAVRPLVAATARLDPVYERAAQSLGATPGRIFRHVLLPQLLPGILAATLLCSVAGLGEYVASVMLYSSAHTPISIAIYTETYATERGHAAALSLVLVLATAVILGGYALLTRRKT